MVSRGQLACLINSVLHSLGWNPGDFRFVLCQTLAMLSITVKDGIFYTGYKSLSNIRSRNSNQELGHWHWCIDTDHQTSAGLTPDQAVQIKTMRCFQQPDDTLGSTYKSCLYASNKRNPDLWNLLSLMELNANKSAPNEVRSISKSRCAMWWNYVRNCSNISTTTLSVECVIGWRFCHLG